MLRPELSFNWPRIWGDRFHRRDGLSICPARGAVISHRVNAVVGLWEESVGARGISFSCKQDEAPPVAEPAALIGQIPQPRVPRTLRLAPHHLAVRPGNLAGPPFLQPGLDLQMCDTLALHDGRHHFLTAVPSTRPYGASTRPAAASPYRSRFQAPSAALPRTRLAAHADAIRHLAVEARDQ